MGKKKILQPKAQPDDIAVARAIAIYFNELEYVPVKILSSHNSVAFYLHQNPWSQHLFSILTQKHADNAFGVFTEVLVALGFAVNKPIK